MRKKTELKLVLFTSLLEGLQGIFADLSAEVIKDKTDFNSSISTLPTSAAEHVAAFQNTMQDFAYSARAAVAKSNKTTEEERAEAASMTNAALWEFFQEWFKVK